MFALTFLYCRCYLLECVTGTVIYVVKILIGRGFWNELLSAGKFNIRMSMIHANGLHWSTWERFTHKVRTSWDRDVEVSIINIIYRNQFSWPLGVLREWNWNFIKRRMYTKWSVSNTGYYMCSMCTLIAANNLLFFLFC